MRKSDFIFYPSLLIRTPAYPYSKFKPDNLATVLLDPQFQQAILLASRELHVALSRYNFIFEALTDELKASVYKYYNRMSHRPTPFGAFASVAMTKWEVVNYPLMRDAGQRLITFDDFRLLSKPGCTFSGDLLLYLNPSLFKSGREYRYYIRNRSNDSQRDAFRIMTIPKTRLLKKLFNYVKEPVSYPSLITFVEHELEQEDGERLIADLVHEQILFHSQMPAITRQEFPSLDQEFPDSSNSYTIAYHKQRSGADISYQAKLYDGLWALSRLAAKVPFTQLQDFAKKFAERFGEIEVPLLRALDPQTGVSYLGSERTVMQHEDAHELNAQQKLDFGPAGAALNRLMVRKLMEHQRTFQEGIVFTREEISGLEKLDEKPLLLPPSIAVTFRLYGEEVIMESAGGNSALAIAGRFSYDKEVLTSLQEIARLEQVHNPNIVFAEIAAMDHFITDNINTRGHLRNYEIPVLVHSELPADRTIKLNDLTIQVSNGRVILRSVKLGKQVIPRLGTAYNYTLSNLPLFRFLADLQFQGLQHNFTFDPEIVVSGLSHYPRFSYNKCILSVAKWIVQSGEIRTFIQPETGKANFLSWAAKVSLPQWFVLADHDRELVFDLKCDDAVGYFLRIINSKNWMVLKEFLFPEKSQAVTDQFGEKYISQQITFLVNQQSVYREVFPGAARLGKARLEKHLPGGEWCYFKIYAHLESQNVLLRDPKFLELISVFLKMKAIRCWFFVRYADPKPHLRLRFRIKGHYGNAFAAEFSAWIKQYVESNLVTDYVIGTYEPEYERYGHAGMKRVEAIFHYSSELVLAFHLLRAPVEQETCFAISSVDLILHEFLPELADKLAFAKTLSGSVLRSPEKKVNFDQSYRLQRKQLDSAMDQFNYWPESSVAQKMKKLSAVLIKFYNAYQKLEKMQQHRLVADLIHMHVNRLNASGRADLELLIYYLLFKFYRSLAARKSRSANLENVPDACPPHFDTK